MTGSFVIELMSSISRNITFSPEDRGEFPRMHGTITRKIEFSVASAEVTSNPTQKSVDYHTDNLMFNSSIVLCSVMCISSCYSPTDMIYYRIFFSFEGNDEM
jgi:hypothetical protein